MERWVYVSFIVKRVYKILFIATAISTITLINGSSLELNCSGEPCMYGICLDNENSSYACYCIDGYTGINCEINWDDCWSDPCLNGGICNDAVAAYNCTCTEGFIGLNCEQKYSECANQPCLNNGTCLDYDGFVCQCPDGYSGDYCEIDISVCNNTICKNFGQCIEGPGLSFFCHCPAGWTGQLCDQDVDECVTSPCKNGGLCINIPATYACACLFGFTGKDCDKAVVPCAQNLCHNGAICLLEDDRPVCYCVPDYHGLLCELKYDDCESKFANCENGGTCIDGINSFTCACLPQYTGMICENYLSFTTSTMMISSVNFSVSNETTTEISSSSTSTSSYTIATSSTILPLYPYTTMSSSSKTTSSQFTKWYPSAETTFSMQLDQDSTDTSIKSTSSPTDSVSIYSSTNIDTPYTRINETLFSTSTSYIAKTDFTTPNYQSTTERTEKSYDLYENTTVNKFPIITDDVTDKISDAATDTTNTIKYYQTTKVSSTTVNGSIGSTSDSNDKSSHAFTDSVSLLNNDNSLGNNTSLLSTFVMETLETTTISSISNEYPFSSSSISPPISDSKSSTISIVTTTGLGLTTNQTITNAQSENITTEYDQMLTPKEQTFTDSECYEGLCTTSTSTVPSIRNTSECECPPHNEDCKTIPKMISAAFNGKSYARQRIDVDTTNKNNATLRIHIRLRTRFKNGMILHVYFDDESYALVYLESGALKFQFSCGLETMLLGEIDSSLDNGYEVEIDMRFQYYNDNESDKCTAKLLVNGTTAVSGEQILSPRGNFPQSASLHLGGIPLAFSHYFPHIVMGFIGCMNSLMINDIPRHFIYDSIETFQIEECTSFFCLSNPCQNFGACEEKNSIIHCRCIAGYTGLRCERSACDDNPCSLGATCISSPGIGFVCICPLGTHGRLCEGDTVVVHPSFSILVPGFSSYIAYGISNSVKDTMELKMKLIPRTLEQISLIAYLGQSGSHHDLSDHLSITYVRGYIMLTWDLGSGVRRIFTSTPLTSALSMTAVTLKSYKPHTLQVGRRGRDAWLSVDGVGNVTGRAAGTMTRLDVSPVLYIGGHKSKNFETLPHDLPLHTGFSGCIFDIELRTKNTVFSISSSSPATGRGVGECHHNECVHHSCKNGAVCLNHGPTYSCICTKDWIGPDCSIPVEAHSSTDLPKCLAANE